MYVFKGKHPRLGSGASHYPFQECSELSVAQDGRFKRGHVLLRYADVQERRQEGYVLGWLQLELRKSVFQFSKTCLGRDIGSAEAYATPLGDGMQRCVL
jgi:hypothetical protein